jgi:hypothetical protein
MAQAKKVRIQLFPAKKERGFVSYTVSLFGKDKYPEQTIEVRTSAEIVIAAAAFAKEHGQPCHASISILEGARKPAGFDAACHHLYYNLDVEPTTEVATPDQAVA